MTRHLNAAERRNANLHLLAALTAACLEQSKGTAPMKKLLATPFAQLGIKAKPQPSKDPLGDLSRAITAAVGAAQAARVDIHAVETVLDEQINAVRHRIAANLRF